MNLKDLRDAVEKLLPLESGAVAAIAANRMVNLLEREEDVPAMLLVADIIRVIVPEIDEASRNFVDGNRGVLNDVLEGGE